MSEEHQTPLDGRPPKICEELIEFVAKYMAHGYKKFGLKKKIETEMGLTISMKTYEVLRNKARELLRDTMLSPQEHKTNALEVIYQQIQDDKVHPSSKLRAAQMLLDASNMIPEQDATNRAEELKRIIAQIDKTIAEEDEDADTTMD